MRFGAQQDPRLTPCDSVEAEGSKKSSNLVWERE